MFGHFELPHFKMNAMVEMPILARWRGVLDVSYKPYHSSIARNGATGQ